MLFLTGSVPLYLSKWRKECYISPEDEEEKLVDSRSNSRAPAASLETQENTTPPNLLHSENTIDHNQQLPDTLTSILGNTVDVLEKELQNSFLYHAHLDKPQNKCPVDRMQTFPFKGKMIHIALGDILQMPVTAIVNPANSGK